MRQPLPLDPASPDVEVVRAHQARLLLSVCEGKLMVSDVPRLPKPVTGSWADFAFTAVESEWMFEDDELHLAIHSSPFRADDDLTKMFRALKGPGEFVLETGDKLKVGAVQVVSRAGHFDVARKTAVTTYTLSIDSWTWEPRDAGCMWVGAVDGAKVEEGNLVLCGKDWWNSKHLRLHGEYDLYLVTPREGPVNLVVDTMGRPLDHHILGTDILALEFALGRPLQLHRLAAVDADGRIVGAAGVGFAGAGRGGSRCPVGGRGELYFINDEEIEEQLWVPVLFRHIARRLHEDGEDSPLTTPISAYLDSLSGHVHASYLLAQVALEAFCSTLVESSTGVLVKDTRAWIRFVEEHRTEFLEHALDTEAGRRLVNKVINAQQAPSTDRVLAAFKHFDLDVPKVARDEVGRRNVVAHRYLMAKESTADWQELADRIAIVQTLLVAVVAKHVGFDGPIVGWEWKHGRRNIPTWWPWKRLEEARRRYLALGYAIDEQTDGELPLESDA